MSVLVKPPIVVFYFSLCSSYGLVRMCRTHSEKCTYICLVYFYSLIFKFTEKYSRFEVFRDFNLGVYVHKATMWQRFWGIKILIEAQHLWSSAAEFYTITEWDSGSQISSFFAFHFCLGLHPILAAGETTWECQNLGGTHSLNLNGIWFFFFFFFFFNWSPTVKLNLCVFRGKLANKNDELKSHYG